MGNSVESFTNGSKIKYKICKSKLKTGDVIIFSGFGTDSKLIKCFTSTPWSHIGIVVKLESSDLVKSKFKDPDGLYLLHSTIKSYNEKVPDVISGKIKGGVQLNSLSGVIAYYKGRIVLRKQTRPFDEVTQQEIETFIMRNHKKPYETGASELLNSVYRGRCAPICVSNENAYFCSELATSIYRDLFKILPSEISSSDYIPADYATGGIVDELLNEYKYGLSKEKEITT